MGDLLKEHLDGYVEEIVRKKYHILKTSDNFIYIRRILKNGSVGDAPGWPLAEMVLKE